MNEIIEKQESDLDVFQHYIWILALSSYLLSMFCPTYCTSSNCPGSFDGLFTTLFGLGGLIFHGGVYFAWLANPLIITSLGLKNKHLYLNLIVTFIALLLCLNFLRGGKVVIDENLSFGEITEFKSGYWLWLTSAVILFLNNLLSLYYHLFKKKNN